MPQSLSQSQQHFSAIVYTISRRTCSCILAWSVCVEDTFSKQHLFLLSGASEMTTQVMTIKFANFPNFQRIAKGAGKGAARKLSKSVEKLLTLFDDFWRFLPCAKIVEKCRKTFWHFFDDFWRFLTWPLSAGPFCNPLRIFLSWNFRRKRCFGTIFPQSWPLPKPLQNAYFTNIVVVASLILFPRPSPLDMQQLLYCHSCSWQDELLSWSDLRAQPSCKLLLHRGIPASLDDSCHRGDAQPFVNSYVGHTPQYGWNFPEKFPRKRYQSVSWNSLREYGWDAPNPIIQGIWRLQSISRILSPQYGWRRLFFQKWFRRGPLRAAHGIPSSTGGISEYDTDVTMPFIPSLASQKSQSQKIQKTQEPAKSKRGWEEGDGTEYVINCRDVCRKLSWHFMTTYDDLWRFYVNGTKRRKLS